MKKKMAWYSGGVLILGLALLTVACDSPIFPQPIPEPPKATIAPPVIPHSLEGRDDCRLCHEAGLGGAPQFPASHSERPSDVCLACHVTPAVAKREGTVSPPATTRPAEPTAPKPISPKELYEAKCAACHGQNRQGVSGLAPALTPENLAGLSDAEIRNVIRNGRPGTPMPAFQGRLSQEEIEALLQHIKYTAP